MAAQLNELAPAQFSGAVVIVGPDGRTIEYYLSDPAQSAEFFWTSVKARIETMWAELQETQRQQEMSRGVYGRR